MSKRNFRLGCLIRVALVLAIAYGGLSWLVPPQRVAEHAFFASSGRARLDTALGFDSIAHRGGAGDEPENTLRAMQRAVEANASILEMDLRLSHDAHVVVIHDTTVDRTTDGSGEVSGLSLAALQRLQISDAKTVGAEQDSDLGPSTRIPTLDEVLARFPHVRFNMELKQESPKLISQVCSTIHTHQAQDRVLMGSFSHDALSAFRKQCPAVATSVSLREALLFYYLHRAGLVSLFRSPAVALQIPETFRGRALVVPVLLEAAHRQNRRVHVWTVNDQRTMKTLIGLGVDGLLTDYPDRLARVLADAAPPRGVGR